MGWEFGPVEWGLRRRVRRGGVGIVDELAEGEVEWNGDIERKGLVGG